MGRFDEIFCCVCWCCLWKLGYWLTTVTKETGEMFCLMATFQIDVSQVLEKHILGFVKKKKKVICWDLNEIDLGDQTGEYSIPDTEAELNRKKTGSSSFLKKDLANELSWLFFLYFPNFPFCSINGFSFPCCVGTCMGLPWLQRVGHNLGVNSTMAADSKLQIFFWSQVKPSLLEK